MEQKKNLLDPYKELVLSKDKSNYILALTMLINLPINHYTLEEIYQMDREFRDFAYNWSSHYQSDYINLIGKVLLRFNNRIQKLKSKHKISNG